jgi:hypothetical protein
MTDQTLFDRINELSNQEEQLWEKAGSGGGLAITEREELDNIKVQLDQCYDLLHQRDARRRAGQDPDEALVRPPEIVERYQQ